MADLNAYRKAIKDLLEWLGGASSPHTTNEATEYKREVIFDEVRDHYQLLTMGWKNNERIFNCIIHLDIENDKVWIQRNQTDVDVASKLVEAGVPKDHIVLGLHAPYKRPYTEYAAA
jgi:hypothetical protein